MEASDDDTELVPLNPDQASQFARIEEVWPEFGHALQIIAATEGGMSWRTVDGVEYLTRYTQVDGKKQARSLGRRSPQTEAQMEHFENTVLKARRIRRERRDEVVLTCKLAKAHGVARLHGTFASALDWLWYTDANKRVALFGGTALLAYESGSKTLAPAALIKDQHLQFVSHSHDLDRVGLREIGEACGADENGGEIRSRNGRAVIRSEGRIVAEVFSPSFFLDRLDGRAATAFHESLEMPWLRSMVFARDSRPIEVSAPDPRVYAIMASCLYDLDDVWQRRAEFSATMVRERWADGFDRRQELVLEELPSGGGRGLRGP